jgi:hypothetical protein
MSRIVSAGDMQDDKIALALFRAHADASDEELRNWNVSRNDLIWLARHYIGEGYNDTALATIADQVIKAFVAGRQSPEKR